MTIQRLTQCVLILMAIFVAMCIISDRLVRGEVDWTYIKGGLGFAFMILSFCLGAMAKEKL